MSLQTVMIKNITFKTIKLVNVNQTISINSEFWVCESTTFELGIFNLQLFTFFLEWTYFKHISNMITHCLAA